MLLGIVCQTFACFFINLLPPQYPLDVIQLVQRLQRRQVVHIEIQKLVADLAEHGVVQLEEAELHAARR